MSEYKRLTEKVFTHDDGSSEYDCDASVRATNNRLGQLEDKIEEGKLVELPCKDWLEILFGDTLIFFGIIDDEDKPYIVEIKVDNESRIIWYDGWKTAAVQGYCDNGIEWNFSPSEVGKTVFLTREAAEARLKELEAK